MSDTRSRFGNHVTHPTNSSIVLRHIELFVVIRSPGRCSAGGGHFRSGAMLSRFRLPNKRSRRLIIRDLEIRGRNEPMTLEGRKFAQVVR